MSAELTETAEHIDIKKLQTYHIYDEDLDSTRECIVLDVTQNSISAMDELGNAYTFSFDGYCQWGGEVLVFEEKPIPEFKPIPVTELCVEDIKPFTVVQLKNKELAIILEIDVDTTYCYRGVALTYPASEHSWDVYGYDYSGIATPTDIEYILLNKNNFN